MIWYFEKLGDFLKASPLEARVHKTTIWRESDGRKGISRVST